MPKALNENQEEPTNGYEVIEYKGQPARRYPDGSIRDDHGYWLAAPPNRNRFDAESGRKAIQKRWDEHREEAAAGLVRAVQKGKHIPGQVGSAQAWGGLVEHAAKTAMKTSSVHGLAEIMRFLGEAVGALPGRGPTADSQPAGQPVEIEVLELVLRRARIKADKFRNQEGGEVLKGESDD